jgi:hypothetical protein
MKTMKKNRSAKTKVRKHAGLTLGGQALIREYARTIATLRPVKDSRPRGSGHDDLPGVKIASPAVKPKGVKPQEIRKAVRKAVQEFIERHGKAVARS